MATPLPPISSVSSADQDIPDELNETISVWGVLTEQIVQLFRRLLPFYFAVFQKCFKESEMSGNFPLAEVIFISFF